MRVIVNEWLTKPISLEHGVRQGVPFLRCCIFFVLKSSCVKFVLVLKSKAFFYQALKDYNTRWECMTSLVKSVCSLEALFHVIRIYERASGAELNVSKTEAMWLGAWRSRTDQPFGLTWVPKIKILGVVFGQAAESDTWQPKLKKLGNHLNLWKSRSLSHVGKSLIVNTLGIRKLLYLATILSVPRWVVSQANNLVWPFLWGCGIETVS